MLQIRGKRTRTVPVILTEEVVKILDVLVAARSKVGISHENKYIFPRGSGLGHIEGHKCLRQFAFAAGLQHPERIGSTNMRKYIATVVQVN